ncbi:hypothetical protein ACGFNU_09040 [Spirillospora sp. NPDC048911]|uniref:hypothetical protein n=1 Tax=Spirillospora sp. NPDC048911 TaxID=3364527 RepID=UPI00371D662D
MTVGRRSVLVGAAALAVTTSATRAGAYQRPLVSGRRPLPWRGMNFDTEREVWRTEYVRREITAIRRQLHCNAILLLGSDLRRLTEAATIAAEQGLYVWFEPRAFDGDARDTLRFVAKVARAAERLRRRYPRVALSLGCELTIFMAGLVPGKDWMERAEALGRPESAGYNRRLDRFLSGAVKKIRPLFGGRLTYTSGVWERVDWRGFDVVGVDLYRDESNEATYAKEVRALHRHGKPVVITEFGCCTYRGAEKQGGSGFMIVDWTKEPPELKGNPIRDEGVQVRYIEECLDVFEAEGVQGAFVYNFIDADSPYSPIPKYDLDMANFSVVKVRPADSPLAYERTGHWEPKLAFHTIAHRFRGPQLASTFATRQQS